MRIRQISAALLLSCALTSVPAEGGGIADGANYYNATLQALSEMEARDSASTESAKTLTPGVPHPGQEEEMVTGRRTVTPVSSCLKRLPEKDAMEIRRSSIKPYEDCLKRLQKVLKDKEKAPVDEGKAEAEAQTRNGEAPEAETPMNYVRVTAPGKEKHRPEKISAGD
jgi:hypothetical protein